MAFRLKRGASVASEVRRIVLRQLEMAISELRTVGDPQSDDAVHDARRRVKKIRAIITYPASTGRNFAEILRVIDSLQLTDNYKVATPADWKDGDDCVIVPAIQDPKELAERFPKGFRALKPYLRMTPQPNK